MRQKIRKVSTFALFDHFFRKISKQPVLVIFSLDLPSQQSVRSFLVHTTTVHLANFNSAIFFLKQLSVRCTMCIRMYICSCFSIDCRNCEYFSHVLTAFYFSISHFCTSHHNINDILDFASHFFSCQNKNRAVNNDIHFCCYIVFFIFPCYFYGSLWTFRFFHIHFDEVVSYAKCKHLDIQLKYREYLVGKKVRDVHDFLFLCYAFIHGSKN